MTTINIGKDAYDAKDIAQKVQTDIYFLERHITLLRKKPNVNPAVLDTYLVMLESRQSILDWLLRKPASSENPLH